MDNSRQQQWDDTQCVTNKIIPLKKLALHSIVLARHSTRKKGIASQDASKKLWIEYDKIGWIRTTPCTVTMAKMPWTTSQAPWIIKTAQDQEWNKCSISDHKNDMKPIVSATMGLPMRTQFNTRADEVHHFQTNHFIVIGRVHWRRPAT